jgi:hypothetical protein
VLLLLAGDPRHAVATPRLTRTTTYGRSVVANDGTLSIDLTSYYVDMGSLFVKLSW